MSSDIGDVFEQQLEKVFKKLNNDHLLQWHAFPDTKRSNGGAISSQPSDYLLGVPVGSCVEQRMMFVEAKASDNHKSLRKSAVQPSQRGFIHRWRKMLDLPYYIIHYSAVGGTLQVWDGMALSENRLNRDYLLGTWEVGAGRQMDIDLAAEALKQFFVLPDKSETVELYNRQG